MKKMYKGMLLVLCAVLLVAASVMGTLAYLQAQTGVVKNTMTVGNVAITLDEATVDVYGKAVAGANRIAAATTANGEPVGNSYKLVPGCEYLKDPTIHVTKGSEPCYVFVNVNNGISNIENADVSIAKQMAAKGWIKLSENGTVWYKQDAVDARNAAVDVIVFENFTIADNADVSAYDNAVISIVAYAVQKEGFNSAQDAWNATFGK